MARELCAHLISCMCRWAGMNNLLEGHVQGICCAGVQARTQSSSQDMAPIMHDGGRIPSSVSGGWPVPCRGKRVSAFMFLEPGW